MKTISARQTGIIVFLTILANKILVLPSILYKNSKADSIFVMLALFFIEFLILLVFLKLKKNYPNQTFLSILQKKLGKIIAKTIIFVFLVFFLFKTMLTYSVLFVYLKDLVYQDEFGFLALICLIPVINHATIIGLRSMSRTFEMFYYLVVVGIVFCLAIAFFTDISTPILFVSPVSALFASAWQGLFAFGDYLVLFIFIDRITIKKGEAKNVILFALVGIIFVLAIFTIFYSKYQLTSFMHNNALADLLVFSVQFNAIGRLDIIAMLTIMTLGLFQLEIFLTAFCDCFVMVFSKLSIKYATAVFDILFLVIYLVLIAKYEVMISLATSILPYLAIVASYLLPILFYALSFKHKREVKDEENH